MKLRYLLAIPASIAVILGVYIARVSAAPLSSTFSDNFDRATFDTGKWTQFGTWQPTTTNGNLYLSVAPSNNYKGADTGSKLFDLTNDQATLQIVSDLSKFSAITSLEVYPMHLSLSGNSNNQYQWFITPNANQIRAYKRVGGTGIQIGASVTYDYATMKWFAISSDGTTVSYKTSPDGFAWTTRFSTSTLPSFMNPSSTLLGFQVGTWQPETFMPPIVFDNYNVIPPLATRKGHEPVGGGVSSGGVMGF